MKETWNTRYSSKEFIYGLEPNYFLKSHLNNHTPGAILLPGDGEGRNAVYAAKLGWDVTAFDYSDVANKKANKLANSYQVNIHYITSDVQSFKTDKKFDLISIIYLHLPPNIRAEFHKSLYDYLKPNCKILLECFSKDQIHNSSGGPKDLDLLYSIEEIRNDFMQYRIELLEQTEITLNEGPLHQGKASVIRLVAYKN